MSWRSKVAWSEGLFLRPQHFQQQDRYHEKYARTLIAQAYNWGFRELALDRDQLTLGRVALTRCAGVWQDGTPFDAPDDCDLPEALVLAEGATNVTVYLVIPESQVGVAQNAGKTSRYHEGQFEAIDVMGSDNAQSAAVALARLRLGLASEVLPGFHCLAVAQVREVRADRQVIFDERHIPPVLKTSVSQVLTGFITEIHGLLEQRSEALAGRLTGTSASVADVADFMLLQTCNRYALLFGHLSKGPVIHPHDLFMQTSMIAGELATFTSANRRPVELPAFDQDQLRSTFEPLMTQVRRSLSAVLESSATQVPLELRSYGVRVGQIADKSLLTGASFILAVRSTIPVERLHSTFPNQTKIGPVERIRELVNVALPGISMRVLAVAPRQIPYRAGTAYFEMDRSSPLWAELTKSGGLALHVAGEIPGLELECWAIREGSK